MPSVTWMHENWCRHFHYATVIKSMIKYALEIHANIPRYSCDLYASDANQSCWKLGVAISFIAYRILKIFLVFFVLMSPPNLGWSEWIRWLDWTVYVYANVSLMRNCRATNVRQHHQSPAIRFSHNPRKFNQTACAWEKMCTKLCSRCWLRKQQQQQQQWQMSRANAWWCCAVCTKCSCTMYRWHNVSAKHSIWAIYDLLICLCNMCVNREWESELEAKSWLGSLCIAQNE